MTLTLVPQARAHSRRNLATAAFTASALQRVDTMSAYARADGTNAPATTTVREANFVKTLRRMSVPLYCLDVWMHRAIRDRHPDHGTHPITTTVNIISVSPPAMTSARDSERSAQLPAALFASVMVSCERRYRTAGASDPSRRRVAPGGVRVQDGALPRW